MRLENIRLCGVICLLYALLYGGTRASEAQYPAALLPSSTSGEVTSNATGKSDPRETDFPAATSKRGEPDSTPSSFPTPSLCNSKDPESSYHSTIPPAAKSSHSSARQKITLAEVQRKLDELEEGVGIKNVIAIDQSINEAAICSECHCGFKLSVSVWFHGIFGYTEEEAKTLHRMANDIYNDSDPCCTKVLLAVKASAAGIQSTAERISRELIAELNKLQSSNAATMKNCLRKINYHFIGFSQGGLAAVSTAPRMPCFLPVGPRSCCGIPKPQHIPIQIDVTTIDSPFNFFDLLIGVDEFLQCGATIAEFCSECQNELAALCGATVLSCPVAWWCSPGAENYGGSPPQCLCGRTSFHLNYQSGGTDKRLKDWGFCDIALPAQNDASEATTHEETVSIVTERYYNQVLKPDCDCNKARRCD